MTKPDLSQDRLKELFDYRDGELHWKSRPANMRHLSSRAGYKNTKDSYWRVVIKGHMYLVHRLVFMWNHGYLPEFVDHANGNREDNSIDNLRPATASENCRNAKIQKNNTSGIKGVRKSKRSPNWECYLRCNRVLKTVYGFESKDDAKEFLDLWRGEAHGKFANNGIHKGALA